MSFWIRCLVFALVVSIDPGFALAESSPLRVVATTGMVADVVRRVGGDSVEVVMLMGAGVDPHMYKPTPRDAQNLGSASVIFSSGLRLEGRMQDLFDKLRAGGRRVVSLGDTLPPEKILRLKGHAEHPDPHVWLDAELWSETVPAVVRGLAEADPVHAERYERNGQTVRQSLAALDGWLREEAARLPESRRVLVTSHDAFNYFGRSYGFRVVGLQGVSTVSEAGLSDMASMVDFLKAHDTRAIFVESSVNPAAIRRIAEDSGAKIGGELFSDAMGQPGEFRQGFDTGTYEGMMKANLRTLVEALQ